MVRLTRAQQQERTRAAVLAAATAEFAEHGYADAKVDRIAERAELTRGAVYSNFPGKRALYLAVLLSSMTPPGLPQRAEVTDLPAAAEAFARVWLERLPVAGDPPAEGRLRYRSLTGVFDDEPGRAALAGVAALEGLLLALALEAAEPRTRRREAAEPKAGRRVRLAELILTLLAGAGHLAQTAPGFGDPFDVARACGHLASLDLADAWNPAYLPFVAPPRECHDPWTPPPGLTDLLTDRPVEGYGDGLVVALGTGRLEAAEEAVRAGDQVTVAVVTDDPAEIGALVRLRIADLAGCLRRVFGPVIRPSLRLVLDDRGALASAVGVRTGAGTEAAVYVRGGEIVARAQGRGAAYAVAQTGGDRA